MGLSMKTISLKRLKNLKDLKKLILIKAFLEVQNKNLFLS